jgi:hypothetical protein
MLQPNLAAQMPPAITPVRIAPCSSSYKPRRSRSDRAFRTASGLTMSARGALSRHLRDGRQVCVRWMSPMDEFDERFDCRYPVAISPVL